MTWETPRLLAQQLRPGHEALLQSVFAAAGDYFGRATGADRPDADAAAGELRACAASPGREVAVLLDRGSGDPVGAIGWWQGNPEPEVTLLGMLMIVPTRRSEGLAREAVEGLERWLAGQGNRRLRTAVGAREYGEQRLVRALGFTAMSIREHTALGLGGSHLALFEKQLVTPGGSRG
jgi:GNAT superfamily N-acetyltransferase